MKKCFKCKETRPYDEFHNSSVRKDGYSTYCKPCSKAWRESNKETLRQKKKDYYSRPEIAERYKVYKAKYYEDNKDYLTNQAKDFYENNRAKRLLIKSKETAKNSGLEHSITLEDIIIPEYCPVLGVKLTATLGEGQVQTNASIDRIDSTKGYVKGNVQVISRKANTMKSNATKEELIKFGEWCLKLKNEDK